MPVTISIEDGPVASPWLSAAIIPGQLSGNMFSPASGNALRAGTTYDFKVVVRNDGNESTEPPTSTGPTGPFVQSVPMIVGGTSPTGRSSAQVSSSAGFPQVELFDVAGTQVWSVGISNPLNVANAAPHTFGYSPSGKIFVLITENPAGILNFFAVAAEQIGTGTNRLRPGDIAYSSTVSSSQGLTQFASTGFGFVPTRDILYISYASTGSTAFQFVDLGPDLSQFQRPSQTQWISAAQAGMVRFSPSGDVIAIVGQTTAPNNDILLYKVPSLDRLNWTRRGMPASMLTVQSPLNLRTVKPNGFEAIRIESGPDTALIDSPTPALPAVAVYLWVDTSSSVFRTVTARQFPQGTAGSMQTPSAFIDRIEPMRDKSALIDANWRAALPPAGKHFCAIAEAFTTEGTLPSDPRQRSGTLLSLLERQIAQRNLAVM